MSIVAASPVGFAYALTVLGVGLLSAWIARYAWAGRETPGATSLAVLMVGVTVWNCCTALTIVLDVRAAVVALEVAVLGAVGVCVAGFLGLAIEYTGREEFLGRRGIALLAVEPVAIVLAAATNPWHGLVWRSIELSSAPLTATTTEYGTLFVVHTIYSYTLIVVGLAIVGTLALRWRSIYRRQAAAVFLGAFVPLVVNVASLTLALGIDVQPLAFAVTGVAAAWAIQNYRLVDLVPIARSKVVETLSDPVIVIGENGRITDVNPAAEPLLGSPSSEVVGHAPGDVLDASPAIVEAFDQIQTADGRANHHVTAGNRHFDVRATPLTDERGDRRGTVVVFHDVTEREANRRDLEHQNEQLDRFASVVSHDLRNPLSIAEGYLELARESGEDDHFEAVQEAHERMHAIIEDVLTLARDGATIETRSRVSLARVADGAWDHVDTDGAELVVDDVAISADPDRLQRLFENCFRNSIEHGVTNPDADAPHDAGGEGTGDDGRSGVLTVRIGPIEPDDPDSLQSADAFGFYVADDGVGIPPEALDTVFEPGHSSSEDGTGLGLSIVQGIAEAHGWSVRATNVEDGGARFEFTGASPVSRADAAVEPMTDGAQR